jgi:hypothetical protein
MKKIALAGLIVVAATVVFALPSEADGRRHRHHHHHHRSGFHSRVIIGFGPSYYWGPPPYWYYHPRPYVVYSPPPVVVQEAPPVYIQQAPPLAPPPAAAEVTPTVEQFWHYCQSAGGYYPTVPSCPEAWVKVPPRP